MRSFFYKVFCVGAVGATFVDAYSLYDAAPLVGTLDSQDVTYSGYIGVGYDSNVNYSSVKEDDSPFVRASVSARYADMESVDKLSYTVRLGFSHYFDLEKGSSVEETRADCALTANMVHAFDASNQLSSSLYVTYSPQADYATGYTPTYNLGDTLNVAFVNVYSHAIDSRWSLNGTLAFRSISYVEEVERCDNRYYFEGGVGVKYRESSIMTYCSDFKYTRELRERGLDSNRVCLTVGFQRALDPFSSCGANVGVQVRFYEHDTFASPYFNFSYRRKLSEGLNAQVFVRYEDENGGSGIANGSYNQTYMTNRSLRFGSRLNYVLSPDVSYFCNAHVIMSDFGDASSGAEDYSSSRYEIELGMMYKFTNNLSGDVAVSYAFITDEHESYDRDVKRWTFSVGASYNF